MTHDANRRAGSLAGLAMIAAGALLALDGAGSLELGFDGAAALISLVAGLGLLTVARDSPGMFVGALARALPGGGAPLWAARAAVVLLAPVAGAGPAAYALLALAQATRGSSAAAQPEWRRWLGTGTVGMSVVVAATALGLQLGSDTVLWAVLLASSGLSVYWWGDRSGMTNRELVLLLGIALFFVAPWFLLGSSGDEGPSDTIVAGVVGALVVLLVFAPRWVRTSRELAEERVERARATERAELAGVVHDSVLQTLALIQSHAEDPAEVKAIARRQERDLRARLFGSPERPAEVSSIATALRAVAAEVEDGALVKIDVVTVGDAPLDEPSGALVAAAREALWNAAKHAPEAPISLFGEVHERGVTAFVRDRGPGFDLEAIPEDRRGVRDSIVARMVRHGGHAAVRSAPGGGCEVRLVLERRR